METKTFKECMDLFINSAYDVRKVFDDFLSMTICSFSFNPATGKSNYEDEYLQIISTYKKPRETDLFPKLLAALVNEMEDRMVTKHPLGFDVLGEYYEKHISRGQKGQFFTPWTICEFMSKISIDNQRENTKESEIMKILDPACGSGRMLLTSSREAGPNHSYYGIDIDHTCVKMAVINLFLSGVWNTEVMCANALDPRDFFISYRISTNPLGIYKIEDKEKSPLWHLNQFRAESIEPIVSSEKGISQLRLF